MFHRHLMMAVLVSCAATGFAWADPFADPSPSCTTPLWPSSAIAGSPPSVATWTRTEFPHEWELQPCVGWGPQQFDSFAAVVGTFQADGMDAVLGRIAAISNYKEMRYWSVTDQRLEPLVKLAFAVEGLAPNNPRSDFTAWEMQVGRELFFSQQDNRSSDPVLYRMRIIERSPDRIVVDITNANKVRRFLLTLFEPGDLRTALFISRTADGIWTCYALSGFHPTSLTGLLDSHKSQVNRVLALYGHIAGLDNSGLPWAK
jgi:hypothetical protein